MTYDKATVTVEAQHEKATQQVRDLVQELHNRFGTDSFSVEIIDEQPLTTGSGASGGAVFAVEVHEYSGEIPLFTSKVRETVRDATVENVDIERGSSKLA
jgi:hypothetical protein